MSAGNDEFIDGDPFNPAYVESSDEVRKSDEKQLATQLEGFLRRRQEAYRRVFIGSAATEDVQIVMDDLRTFTRGDVTTFHENERISTLLQGRQEVWLRINDHTRLSFDALFEKYSRRRDSHVD